MEPGKGRKITYNDRITANIFSKRICPICEKSVVRPTFKDYVYKEDGYTFCSWNCMRKYERDPSLIKISKEVSGGQVNGKRDS